MMERTIIDKRLAGIFYFTNNEAPGVVLFHGFGSSKESAKIGEVGIELNNKGLNVLRFDFSGHGESEGKFSNVTVSSALEDAQAAVSFMRKKTSGKIGLFGASFGGMISLLEAAKSEEIAALAVCAAPCGIKKVKSLWNREEIISRYNDFGAQFLAMMAPFVEEGSNFMKDAERYDIAAEASKISIPVLFLHGDNDIIVPLSESRILFDSINGEKELAVIQGADHFLKDKELRKLIVEKIVEWFAKWLS